MFKKISLSLFCAIVLTTITFAGPPNESKTEHKDDEKYAQFYDESQEVWKDIKNQETEAWGQFEDETSRLAEDLNNEASEAQPYQPYYTKLSDIECQMLNPTY